MLDEAPQTPFVQTNDAHIAAVTHDATSGSPDCRERPSRSSTWAISTLEASKRDRARSRLYEKAISAMYSLESFRRDLHDIVRSTALRSLLIIITTSLSF